jgi:hypothetical protein
MRVETVQLVMLTAGAIVAGLGAAALLTTLRDVLLMLWGG